MKAAEAQLGSVAGSVTRLVGDGCVIRRLEPSTGELRAVAADHRDPDQRLALELLIRGRPLGPPAGGGCARRWRAPRSSTSPSPTRTSSATPGSRWMGASAR